MLLQYSSKTLWKLVKISSSYDQKQSGTLFMGHRVYYRIYASLFIKDSKHIITSINTT